MNLIRCDINIDIMCLQHFSAYLDFKIYYLILL